MCKGSQQWSLSLFSNAGGKEREKAQRIFEEFERIGKGEYCLHGAEGIEEGKRREKHSCGMISTVFVIRIRNMCLSLCVFVLLTYWQECLCSR